MGSSNPETCLIPVAARGLRVLLVDQDPTSLFDIALVLEEQFYRVTTIGLASVALYMIEEGEDQFDLVIADSNMEEMDIYKFLSCALLKRDMPVIFMSIEENVDMARKTLSEGACFFFQKPICRRDLVNIWQHVYRKRISAKVKNQIEENEKNAIPKNDSPGGNIVNVDSSWRIAARNYLHGAGNDQLPTKREREDEKKDGLLEVDLVQELHDNYNKQMMNAEKEKQGESDGIQRTKTIEKDSCDPGLAEGDCARESIRTPQVMGVGNGKHRVSCRKRENNDNKERGEMEKRTQGLKYTEEDGSSRAKRSRIMWTTGLNNRFMEERWDMERRTQGLKSTEEDCSSRSKSLRVRWTTALNNRFMEAIVALGNKKPNPKAVLRMMNDHRLTVRQVSSHLQKYRHRVKQINSIVDSSLFSHVFQPNVPRRTSTSPGANGFHAPLLDPYKSVVYSQRSMTLNSELRSAAAQFTRPVSLPCFGRNVSTSVHYDIEKLRQALCELAKKSQSSSSNNFSGVQVASRREFHEWKKPSTGGACQNGTIRSAFQKDERLAGFYGSTRNYIYNSWEKGHLIGLTDTYPVFEVIPDDVHHQLDALLEWINGPNNLQHPNQVPAALQQSCQETNFLQWQTCSGSFQNSNHFPTEFQAINQMSNAIGGSTALASSGCEGTPSIDFAELQKLLEEDAEPEEINGPPDEVDIDSFVEWLGTPP